MKGKKRLHIIIAESDEGHILGFISISNYVKGVDMFFNHNMPCADEDLYYVNYIQTRHDAKQRKIASVLLGYALNEVFYNDNAYAVNYDPICNESENLMNKITKPMKLKLKK